jgi:hypothetical protein
MKIAPRAGGVRVARDLRALATCRRPRAALQEEWDDSGHSEARTRCEIRSCRSIPERRARAAHPAWSSTLVMTPPLARGAIYALTQVRAILAFLVTWRFASLLGG